MTWSKFGVVWSYFLPTGDYLMHPDDEWLLHHPTSHIFHSHHQLFLASTICTSIMHHIFSCFCYFLLITSHNISTPICANNTYPDLLGIGVSDTLSDSIQCLNFAKKWFIQYSIQYCFTQDSIQNIIQFKINSADSI